MSVWLSIDSVFFYSLMPEPFFPEKKIVTLWTGFLPVGFCSHISYKWCSWDKKILEKSSKKKPSLQIWACFLEPSYMDAHMGIPSTHSLVHPCSMLLGEEGNKCVHLEDPRNQKEALKCSGNQEIICSLVLYFESYGQTKEWAVKNKSAIVEKQFSRVWCTFCGRKPPFYNSFGFSVISLG